MIRYLRRAPIAAERVKQATGPGRADVILRSLGGDISTCSTKCIAFGGRLLVVGFTSGRIPSIQINRVLLKKYRGRRPALGAYRQHDPDRIPQAMAALFDLYARGTVRPVISSNRPLREAAAALEEIASRRSVGKVLLHP